MVENKRHTKPRKEAEHGISPNEHVRMMLYDGEIPMENASKEILSLLESIVGRLRGQSNEHYLLLRSNEMKFNKILCNQKLLQRPRYKKLLRIK